MAVDMFLKIEGVDGESTDSKHSKSIDILTFGWGANNSATFMQGGGGGGGKVNINTIHLNKYVDKASPKLFLACAAGTHYKSALITMRKSGDKPLEYLKYKLTDVMVSSLQQSASGHGERMAETLELAFSKVEVIYTPQKQDGSGDGVVQTGWDIKGNTKVG